MLACWILTIAFASQYFDYFDSNLQSVSAWPYAEIADKLNPPNYTVVLNTTSNYYGVWNYIARSYVNDLVNISASKVMFSSDSNMLLYNTAINNSGYFTYVPRTNGKFTDYTTFGSIAGYSHNFYGVADLNYLVTLQATD